jgi:hypothetical protein
VYFKVTRKRRARQGTRNKERNRDIEYKSRINMEAQT